MVSPLLVQLLITLWWQGGFTMAGFSIPAPVSQQQPSPKPDDRGFSIVLKNSTCISLYQYTVITINAIDSVNSNLPVFKGNLYSLLLIPLQQEGIETYFIKMEAENSENLLHLLL